MYRQLIPFNQALAGKTPYKCLNNVRLGYSIPNKYKSAYIAWQHTQQHPDRQFPACDVPVYFTWEGTVEGVYANWGHIAVRLANGQVWTDGHIYGSVDDVLTHYIPGSKKSYLGWGESINDIKVIQEGMPVSKDAMTKEELTLLHELALFAPPGPLYLQAFTGQPFMAAANSLRNDPPYKNATRAALDKKFAGIIDKSVIVDYINKNLK
jgi:hypothetical protein